MTNSSRFYACVMATSALTWCVPALGQSIPDPQDSETIVVTGSLITRQGFSSPTPVSTLTGEDITNRMPNTVADLLNTMPQFGVTARPIGSWSSAGMNPVNLRNLGTKRTLVLLDGKRIVASNTSGAIDTNTLPLTLLKRVDVVTGGASAAYGSDAVSGVVNFIIDRKFTGLKANIQYGNSGKMDYPNYKADIAAGASFADGRGHVVASLSYLDNPRLLTGADRSWSRPVGVVLNPAYAPGNGQPQYIHVENTRINGLDNGGGLITSGPLINTEFIGPEGTPIRINPGVRGGGFFNYGGTPETISPLEQSYGAQYGAFTSYSNISYEVSDSLTADVSFSYSKGWSNTPASGYLRIANLTIRGDNAFIPQATLDAMAEAGITSFVMGTRSASIHDAPGRPYGMNYDFNRDIYNGSLRLAGSFENWNWSLFYAHGEGKIRQRRYNNVHVPSFLAAVDSIQAPAGNAAGIPAGTIVCRSTLTNPNNGCVPYNPFGIRELTDAQRAYLTPVPSVTTKTKLNEVNAQIQGDPFSTWAGPVSLAIGGAFRKESAVQTPDALTLGGGFYSGNEPPFSGSVKVWEGYGEIIVPLAADQGWAQNMELNAAFRGTHYSTSGMAKTWKVGLTNQVNDDILLRATWSRDIRAPSIIELFNAGSYQGVPVFDPFTGEQPASRNVSEGNPNLQPEKANTLSAGIVLTPSFASGLQASLDFYHIKISDAVELNGTGQQIVDKCFAGDALFCQFIDRDTNGSITLVHRTSVNTARAKTWGFDAELQYRRDMLGGKMGLHIAGNYTIKNINVVGGISRDIAGSLYPGDSGVPKLIITGNLSYERGMFTGNLRPRYLGSGKYSKRPELANIDDNHIPAIMYLDVDASVKFGTDGQFRVFGAVDNLLDKDPRIIPALNDEIIPVLAERVTRGGLYDVIGRRFRVGLNMTF